MTLRETASQLYDSLNFTHKVHEKQCEVLSIGSITLRLISIALMSTILLLQFLQVKVSAGQNSALLNWSIGLAVTEVALLAFQLNFNFDKLLDQHRMTAKKALSIKNDFLIYIAGATISQSGLEKFVEEINDVYDGAPQTGGIAKWLANRTKS